MSIKLKEGSEYTHTALLDYYQKREDREDIQVLEHDIGDLDTLYVKNSQLDLCHLFIWTGATGSGVSYYKLIHMEGLF